MTQSARCVGSVADQSGRHKHNHYTELKRDYIFTPVAFETFGPMGEESKKFIHKLGKLLQIKTGEKRSTNYLIQQLSIENQRGNAASILKTFETSDRDTICSNVAFPNNFAYSIFLTNTFAYLWNKNSTEITS